MRINCEKNLIVEDKIILFLFKHDYLKNKLIYPLDITQEGIQKAVNCDHAHVSRILHRNIKEDFISKSLSRIENKNRKQHIYLLTDKGVKYALELMERGMSFKSLFAAKDYHQKRIIEFY